MDPNQSSQPNSSRASSRQNTGRLPMGWADEGNTPEANAKREASRMKSKNAEDRKLAEQAKKAKERQNKKEEAQQRKSNKNRNGSSGSSNRGSSGSSSGASKNAKKTSKSTGNSATADNTSEGAAPTMESLLKEIERLRYQNETLDTARKRSEHEKDNLEMVMNRVKLQLAEQQQVYDVDVGKLRKRISAMQERVSVVTRLESGLIELCLEVRDRSADDINDDNGSNGNDARRHENSKRELLKRCNNDVLVVLDHLRANLRIQLAFKEVGRTKEFVLTTTTVMFVIVPFSCVLTFSLSFSCSLLLFLKGLRK